MPNTAQVKNKISAKHQRGFTLIEVMVVIVILGVLAALIVPNVMGRGEKAKVDTTAITLKGVAGALDQYKLDNGHYPNMQEGGLEALVKKPESAKNWLPGGYVKGGYQKTAGKMTFNMSFQVQRDALLICTHLVLMDSQVAKKQMPIFIISPN